MPRRSISRINESFCYHITQRCQERGYLFEWKTDRRQYLKRLRQMSRLYPVSVLNYMITGNHVHLLLWSRRSKDVAAGMQFLSGTSSQDYNRRKNREGSFWSGRYRPTVIESGSHLSRCFFYIELNMVRAKAVGHPSQWFGGAFEEHAGHRKRYCIIDRERLLHCLGCPCLEHFRNWYHATLNMHSAEYMERESYWTEAAAVGSRDWVERLTGKLPSSSYELKPAAIDVGEDQAAYVVHMSNRKREGLLSAISNRP